MMNNIENLQGEGLEKKSDIVMIHKDELKRLYRTLRDYEKKIQLYEQELNKLVVSRTSESFISYK